MRMNGKSTLSGERVILDGAPGSQKALVFIYTVLNEKQQISIILIGTWLKTTEKDQSSGLIYQSRKKVGIYQTGDKSVLRPSVCSRTGSFTYRNASKMCGL